MIVKLADIVFLSKQNKKLIEHRQSALSKPPLSIIKFVFDIFWLSSYKYVLVVVQSLVLVDIHQLLLQCLPFTSVFCCAYIYSCTLLSDKLSTISSFLWLWIAETLYTSNAKISFTFQNFQNKSVIFFNKVTDLQKTSKNDCISKFTLRFFFFEMDCYACLSCTPPWKFNTWHCILEYIC